MKKPNIILVNCDDLGYGDLGCYGSTDHQTPHLDRMAKEGMRFTDFYMASPVCSASRAAMLTGSYPQRVGIYSVLFPASPIGLNPDEITIAGALKNQGYTTQLVGKWHCGDQSEFLPTRHGFDHYYGLPYSNDMGRQPEEWQKNRPPLPLMRDEDVIEQQPDQSSLTERYLEESVRFIRENKKGPFFLYLAHMYVHLPLYVPERFLRDNSNPYAGAVACIDWVMGVLMHELRELGIEEETLVVFTSDNGSRCDYGKSNGVLRGGKGTSWEGGQRLPCIMRMPGTVPAGTVCSEITASLDFLPTLDRLAGGGLDYPHRIDGKDIGPLMRNEVGAKSPHEAFFYYGGETLMAVRKGKWKLHFQAGKETINELYDLESDVEEKVNVYEQHPGVVAELSQLADACRADLGDAAREIPRGPDCREPGRVKDPAPLCTYQKDHPYFMAEYDLSDCG